MNFDERTLLPMTAPTLHVSVVSHRQNPLVRRLLDDLSRQVRGADLMVTLTLNTREDHDFNPGEYPFSLHLIHNERPLGFAANHNRAFRHGMRIRRSDYYCVLNPDVLLLQDVFQHLIPKLGRHPSVGIIAPLVRHPDGHLEDSARRLPTPASILLRVVGRKSAIAEPRSRELSFPDWVAGMFMLFPSRIYDELAGLDEKFFLYCEDVDICCRARLRGYQVAIDPETHIIHEARRASHRDLRHFSWHLRSMLQFFASPTFFRSWRYKRARRTGSA
jgi:N-acetylglucosaminyl-diphospho-decaprenol L-rhamnosyltransferase